MTDLRELSPVRLTGGGEMLLLVDARGAEYVVPLDGRLRDTLGSSIGRPTGLPARPGPPSATTCPTPGTRQKEPIMSEAMRPREIQDRVRSGESAEDLAAAAGTPVEKVLVYAGPVLAERAHVAQTALEASVRRPGDGGVRMLGEAALARLREDGSDPETLEWDAWRREDGRWSLEAAYRSDGEARTARLVFDQRGRFVTAVDDEARWLVGDVPLSRTSVEPGPPLAPEETVEAPRLRLASVPGEEVLETGAAFSAPGASDDAAYDVAPRTTEPLEADDDQQLDLLLDGRDPGDDGYDDPSDREDTAGLARRHPRKQRGRASVPTWDEIMFGGRD